MKVFIKPVCKAIPHFTTPLLPDCLATSLYQCQTASLYHCLNHPLNASLPHCTIVRRCPTALMSHCSPTPLPHCLITSMFFNVDSVPMPNTLTTLSQCPTAWLPYGSSLSHCLTFPHKSCCPITHVSHCLTPPWLPNNLACYLTATVPSGSKTPLPDSFYLPCSRCSNAARSHFPTDSLF